jgi:hypothetical protein
VGRFRSGKHIRRWESVLDMMEPAIASVNQTEEKFFAASTLEFLGSIRFRNILLSSLSYPHIKGVSVYIWAS